MLAARCGPVIMTFGCRALWLLETWSSQGSSAFLPHRLSSSPDSSSRFLRVCQGSSSLLCSSESSLFDEAPLLLCIDGPLLPASSPGGPPRCRAASCRHLEITLSNSDFSPIPINKKNPSSPASAVSACWPASHLARLPFLEWFRFLSTLQRPVCH